MSSNIPIVQGVAIGDSKGDYQQHEGYQHGTKNHSDYQGIPSSAEGNAPTTSITPIDPQHLQELREHPQQQFQDVVWAVAFVLHLVAMIGVIVMGMQSSSNSNADDNAEGGGASLSGNIIFLVGITGVAALALSVGALTFMMNHAESLVQTALIFSVVTSLAVGILGFMIGSIMMGVVGLISFAVGICYAKIVWPRIPFAAANLNTALTCVKSNLGLSAVSFAFTAAAFGWSILWFMGVGGALEGSNSAVLFVLVSIARCGRETVY